MEQNQTVEQKYIEKLKRIKEIFAKNKSKTKSSFLKEELRKLEEQRMLKNTNNKG